MQGGHGKGEEERDSTILYTCPDAYLGEGIRQNGFRRNLQTQHNRDGGEFRKQGTRRGIIMAMLGMSWWKK